MSVSDQPAAEQGSTPTQRHDFGPDVDKDVLDQVLDDASTGNEPDAFDPDAATEKVRGDEQAPARGDSDNSGHTEDPGREGTISAAF